MWDLITQNKDILIVSTNFGTLIIWLVYAQLLYSGFRRQRSPKLIINRGSKKDINALCIISNMSAEAIFISYVFAEIETNQGTIELDVTDLEHISSEDNNSENDSDPNVHGDPIGKLSDNTRQGPLASGGYLHIGSFNSLICRIGKEEGLDMDGHIPRGSLEFISISILLVAIYGPEKMPVGAERRFRLNNKNSKYSLTPEDWDTKLLTSRRQRIKLNDRVNRFDS
ncbi:hypothetical protein SAMN05878437_1858 [Vreelandella subglaciescola]|uniref:Uncharacterized protein n=1 Tax=Vreelandella subglaciescola TaxID=29571 RepID=A0A1M7H284_9GAMM|nr:hypothetical protein SAMN05878437_1858 [Halomonas subglaciescola]